MISTLGYSYFYKSLKLFKFFVFSFISTSFLCANDLVLKSFSTRARVSEKTLLGKDAPEDFKSYDLAVDYGLPWERYSNSGWGVGSRLMLSAGYLEGAGESAFVLSAVPKLSLGSKDGRYFLDFGAGAALFTRHRFGTQNFGSPL